MAEQRHIPKDELTEMFANIKAKTPWDINGNMLWGYFFTSSDKGDLEKLGANLVGADYHLVEIRQLETDNPSGQPEWQLHVERIETQSVDSLDATNIRFEALANQYKKVTYDGMDVGPTAEQ